MARVGKADREHSGHYLTAVVVVAVAVAGMAWFGQNRTLGAAAAALGLYALHLFSIRFLLDNQKRQQRVLDAQWEVLQKFINAAESDGDAIEDLVPAMPVDRDDPERLESPVVPVSGTHPAEEPVADVQPAPPPQKPEAAEPKTDDLLAVRELVPPVEALGPTEPGHPIVLEEDPVDSLSDIPGLEMAHESDGPDRSDDSYRSPAVEVPVPRHFALGTVALVRDLLTPAEVARVLLEQRRQPAKKFGVLAVEMGLLTESQREALLLAQQEGLFTDAEMRDARQRLREFRENAAHSMASLD